MYRFQEVFDVPDTYFAKKADKPNIFGGVES